MPDSFQNAIVAEDLMSIIATPLDWERFSGKTILITGAAGFLPAYMVETLLLLNSTKGLNCRVLGLVRNLAKANKRFMSYKNRRDFKLLSGDVSTAIACPEKCDFIIHAASQASPKYYGSDPVGTMTANFLGSFHLLNLAREWNSEGFLYFSSGEVYGEVSEEKIPTLERDYGYIDILNVRSCYAESKRAAETLCVSFANQYNVPVKIIRPFHTYGPGMALDDGRVFADFVRDVINCRDLVLRSDGSATRAFCYLSDAIVGYFTVLLKGDQAVAYNVGNPDGAITIKSLAYLLTELFPERLLGVVIDAQTAPGYIAAPVSISIPNVDRLKSLGWRPSYSIREGFRRTIRSIEEEPH